MVAEVGQDIAFVNVTAGVLANRNSIVDGPTGYTSSLSLDFENDSMTGGFDLKTQMRHSKNHSTVGIEIGPRLKRRFGNGMEFFIKGSAEAVSRYDRDGEMTPTPPVAPRAPSTNDGRGARRPLEGSTLRAG